MRAVRNTAKLHPRPWPRAARNDSREEFGVAGKLKDLRARVEVLRAAQFELEVSRDRYAHLYEFAPVGYLSLNATGRIVEINLTATRMLGRARTALLNHPFSIYVAKADLSRFFEHLRRCRGRSSKVVSELRLRRPDGTEAPVQLVSSPLPSLLWSGSVLYHTALTDLTLRKQMEYSLRRNEERLQLALRAAGAGACDLDLTTGSAAWSDEFSSLLGLDSRQTLASYDTLIACVHPKDRAAVQRALVDGRHSQVHAEFRVWHPRKGLRWLDLVGRVSREENGRPARLSGIGIDITERKHADELSRKASQTLEQRVRARTAELSAANAELEHQIAERKRLEHQLLEISEREQRRIGQD